MRFGDRVYFIYTHHAPSSPLTTWNISQNWANKLHYGSPAQIWGTVIYATALRCAAWSVQLWYMYIRNQHERCTVIVYINLFTKSVTLTNIELYHLRHSDQSCLFHLRHTKDLFLCLITIIGLCTHIRAHHHPIATSLGATAVTLAPPHTCQSLPVQISLASLAIIIIIVIIVVIFFVVSPSTTDRKMTMAANNDVNS